MRHTRGRPARGARRVPESHDDDELELEREEDARETEEEKEDVVLEAQRRHEMMPLRLQEIVPLEDKTGRVFAIISEGKVHSMVEERINIADEWHPDVLSSMVDITDLDPRPEVGWAVKGDKLEAPADEPLPPRALRNRAFLAGVKVNGATFRVSQADFQRLAEVAQHVALFDEFPNEAATYAWPSDPPTEFSHPKEFLQTFRRISSWRDKWNKHAEGQGEAPEAEIEV